MDKLNISIIPKAEFERAKTAKLDKYKKLQLIADMCRLNAFAAVKKAGSGHLGSSLSSMDVFVALYLGEMNLLQVGVESPDRDVFFSSKGHDCPGQYSVLAAAGVLGFNQLLRLRRLGGLDGHPDVKIRGIEANSGSLGMGISKAKGIALAKRICNQGGRVFVLTGDGELQEGQIWESLQTAVHQGVSNINVIVDFNKIQTDKLLAEIIDLGDLVRKFEAFGWYVERCDGHDFTQLDAVFSRFKEINDRPKALIADTVKGKGISFMEGSASLKEGGGLYRWHSGAPDDAHYEKGFAELVEKINQQLHDAGLEALALEEVENREKKRHKLKDTAEKVVKVYEDALLELGGERPDIVVLDADLSADCGLRKFENRFPERFIECGIAEQDMVSTAGGLALQGLLPIVNSFGVFLASRSNEQIYTNATEETKIIYVCHYAGLIPAGPGKSHQSLRDISLFGALPECTILQPCNGEETKQVLRWCVEEAQSSCMIRLVISPSPRVIGLPAGYRLTAGQGVELRAGTDAVIFAYGPVMLHEALIASEILEKEGFFLKVVNMPWLNRIDRRWFEGIIDGCPAIVTLDDHATNGGLGDTVANVLLKSMYLGINRFLKLGIKGQPACGTPEEVLRHHRLDGESLANVIRQESLPGVLSASIS